MGKAAASRIPGPISRHTPDLSSHCLILEYLVERFGPGLKKAETAPGAEDDNTTGGKYRVARRFESENA